MSGDLMKLAEQMKRDGASWNAVLGELRKRGASRLDLVRTVRDVEGLTAGEATRIVNESGVIMPKDFEVTVDEQDPFYEPLFTDEFEGGSDDDH